MTDGYSFQPAVGMDVHDTLMAETQNLKNMLADLERDCQAFLNANQGESSVAYDSAQRAWSAGQAKMSANLAGGGSALMSIRDGYVTADQQAARHFSG